MGVNVDALPDSSRMINPALGSGSLFGIPQGAFDLSNYSTSLWSAHQLEVDDGVAGACQGMLMMDLDNAGRKDSTAVLQCDEGDLVVAYPPYQPETFYIHPRPSRFPGPKGTITSSTTHHHPPHDGNYGMSYEADEVARCIRDGKIESERMPWEESRVVQGWVDKVRKEGPSETAKLVGTAGQ
ncbi:hypothetical protein I306_06538 [Cryptococcus gattii EJB2]|uniref:Gfo/Idh/MocA-like oxidoreductase C-terminal domain-containing protein n=1 Tax=Cryptococcus gattii EJB2 TaxID=1296103 RepID=A0ABR5BLG1_9TREE|nr:hypothetical protein I306_06538 [Cryptococcus gattii EJB2]KJD99506.1 hypothetical protein I311_06910 [Cryptococcus gattii NT-10]